MIPFPMGHNLYLFMLPVAMAPSKEGIYSLCILTFVCAALRDVRKEELDCETRNCVFTKVQR